jgi:serine phosphatase RsbU (regulator of sigma subunit)
VLILGVNPRRPLDADCRAFFRLIAHHVALALTNAAAHEAERARARELEEIALTLQRSLLPRRLPEVPGVELAASYVPAGHGLEVGGDFYDAIELGDGRIVIAIGDVAGHGILAAAVMGQLLHALRAYALEGHMPAVLTANLDRLVLDAELTMTTCLCGVFDPVSGILEYANAGHPPPLIRRAGGSVERAWDGRGVALGVGPSAPRKQTRLQLAVGDVLLLYTDGLIERRGEPLDVGIDRLATLLAGAAPAAAAICGEIVAALTSEPADDIALLALGLAPRAGTELS